MKEASSISSMPKKLAEMLNYFLDIAPADLPNELPLLSNIQLL